MRISEYEDFYTKVIDGYISELLGLDQVHRALNINHSSADRIYRYYEEKRMEVRTVCMVDPDKPIDRHKTAACMMYAILRARPFEINASIKNLPEKILLANEYLAISVAINIVENFRFEDERRKQKKGYEEISPEAYKIALPKTKYEKQKDRRGGGSNNSFLSSICLTLAMIDDVKYMDVLSYATILFLLELYTDKKQ